MLNCIQILPGQRKYGKGGVFFEPSVGDQWCSAKNTAETYAVILLINMNIGGLISKFLDYIKIG